MAKHCTQVTLEITWEDHADVDWGPAPHPKDWDLHTMMALNEFQGERVVITDIQEVA